MGHAIEWLRAELAAKAEELAQADAEINKLEDKLTEAMRALEFYGSEISWRHEQFIDIDSAIDEDGGYIARAALARLRAKC